MRGKRKKKREKKNSWRSEENGDSSWYDLGEGERKSRIGVIVSADDFHWKETTGQVGEVGCVLVPIQIIG